MLHNYKLRFRDGSSRAGGLAVITKSNLDAGILNQIEDHGSLFPKLAVGAMY